MDEPSAALTESEIEDLFTFIRRLKETGVGGVAGTPFGQKIAEKMGMA